MASKSEHHGGLHITSQIASAPDSLRLLLLLSQLFSARVQTRDTVTAA